MPPEVCPNCGATVPRGAKACPECGADEETGWSETAYEGNLGLPDDEFDYDNFVKEEFGAGKSPVPAGVRWYWWLIALALAMMLLFFWIRF